MYCYLVYCPYGEEEGGDAHKHEKDDRQDEGEEDYILVKGVAEDGREGGQAESQAVRDIVTAGVARELAVGDGGQDGQEGEGQAQHDAEHVELGEAVMEAQGVDGEVDLPEEDEGVEHPP